MSIDLNCDLGELPGAVFDGTQQALMASITSANIACGGHAGDDKTMEETIRQAMRNGVAIGAHPGFPDRANFGRLPMAMSGAQIAQCVQEQIEALDQVARRCGATIGHVKPHGALYNLAARDASIARAIAEGVARWRRDVTLVGLAGSAMLQGFRELGFDVAGEAFADRRYEPDGQLRSRRQPDALIDDPQAAAEQALGIAKFGRVIAVDGSAITLEACTICLHGDTPGCVRIAAAVAAKLREAGVRLQALKQGSRKSKRCLRNHIAKP